MGVDRTVLRPPGCQFDVVGAQLGAHLLQFGRREDLYADVHGVQHARMLVQFPLGLLGSHKDPTDVAKVDRRAHLLFKKHVAVIAIPCHSGEEPVFGELQAEHGGRFTRRTGRNSAHL